MARTPPQRRRRRRRQARPLSRLGNSLTPSTAARRQTLRRGLAATCRQIGIKGQSSRSAGRARRMGGFELHNFQKREDVPTWRTRSRAAARARAAPRAVNIMHDSCAVVILFATDLALPPLSIALLAAHSLPSFVFSSSFQDKRSLTEAARAPLPSPAATFFHAALITALPCCARPACVCSA